MDRRDKPGDDEREERKEMKFGLIAFAAAALTTSALAADGGAPRNDLPQPYRTTRDWGELPPGVKWAAVTAVEAAPDGNIYVIHRCFQNSCAGRPEAPILKYNARGRLLDTIGAEIFVFPHGSAIDAEGNLWVTDAGGSSITGGAGGVVSIRTLPTEDRQLLRSSRSRTQSPASAHAFSA